MFGTLWDVHHRQTGFIPSADTVDRPHYRTGALHRHGLLHASLKPQQQHEKHSGIMISIEMPKSEQVSVLLRLY